MRSMRPNNDFCDPMIEEVISDAADSFFGARRQLDGMMDLFQSYVEAFREKEVELAARAGFVKYLLLGRETAGDFYKSISIDSPEILLEGDFSDNALPATIPFAFTVKGEYISLVLRAYNDLQKASDEYINGENDNGANGKGTGSIVYYNLIIKMCELINEKVHQMNTEMSPITVLQFFRRLNPGTGSKERITGGNTFDGYERCINQKLAYQPINFDSLQLKKYPELPKQDQVDSDIISFCKKIYSGNKEEIKKRLSQVKGKVFLFSSSLCQVSAF